MTLDLKFIEANRYKNKTIYDEAFDFIASIFKQNVDDGGYTNTKKTLWKFEPFPQKEIVLIAYLNNKIIAALRIVDREVYIGGCYRKVAGLTSICVRHDFRKQGVGEKLINKSLEIIKSKRYELAILFGRKAVDNYYTKYGFFGLSSYNKINIKMNKISVSDAYKIESDTSLTGAVIKILDTFYNNSYKNCSGRMNRKDKYWKYVLAKIDNNDVLILEVISNLQGVAGYIIRDKYVVYEIGFDGLSMTANYIFSHCMSISDQIIFEMSVEHELFKYAHNFDIAVSYRRCDYGGHMVRLLNKKDGVQMKPVNEPTYKETLSYLNISILGLHEGQPFNVCEVDHL